MLKCLPKDIRFFGVSFDQQLCTSSLDKVRERERKRKEIRFVDKNFSEREGKLFLLTTNSQYRHSSTFCHELKIT